MFECEFSKPDLRVEWQQGGKPIPRSYKFTPRNDGKTYRLLIKDASTDDAGPITCVFHDAQTTAKLIVKGIKENSNNSISSNWIDIFSSSIVEWS